MNRYDHQIKQMLSDMLSIGLHPKYRKALEDFSPVERSVNALRTKLTDMRKAERQSGNVSPHTFSNNERALIRQRFQRLIRSKKTAILIEVGGPITPKVVRESKSTLKITLGCMWNHTVFEPFYRHDDSEGNRPTVILAARERRTNVPHIVVHSAKIYNFQKRKIEDVFIGQTTLGKKKFSILRTASGAVNMAIKLAEMEITKKLKIEDGETQ